MHSRALCQHNRCPSSFFFSFCLSDCLPVCPLSCLFPGPGGTPNRWMGQGCTNRCVSGVSECVRGGSLLDALVGVVASIGCLFSCLPGDLPGQFSALSRDCRACAVQTGWASFIFTATVTAVAGGLVRRHGSLLLVGGRTRMKSSVRSHSQFFLWWGPAVGGSTEFPCIVAHNA